MRFRLRTLLIVLAMGPPMLAWGVVVSENCRDRADGSALFGDLPVTRHRGGYVATGEITLQPPLLAFWEIMGENRGVGVSLNLARGKTAWPSKRLPKGKQMWVSFKDSSGVQCQMNLEHVTVCTSRQTQISLRVIGFNDPFVIDDAGEIKKVKDAMDQMNKIKLLPLT